MDAWRPGFNAASITILRGCAAAPPTWGQQAALPSDWGPGELPLFLRQRWASSAICLRATRRCFPYRFHFLENTMGKYFLAWLLGVPGIVLLLVYLFFH